MYKLITHTDLDGVSCAVLGKLAWKDEVDVTFCHTPDEVTKYLTDIYETGEWKNYDLIFVTDLSFDVSVLKTCPKLKNVLRLFDHHATSIEPFKPYFKWAYVYVTLNGRLTCGTELFYQYLRAKNLVGNRDFYVEQVRLYDTWDWSKGNSRIPQYLSNIVFRIGLQYFYHTFRERLAHRDVNELTIFNQYERDILTFDETRERKDVDAFLKQTYLCDVVTPDGKSYKVGVIFNGSYYSSLLGNEMCCKLGVDIAFMVNLNRSKVEVRTARDDIDLGAMMKTLYNGGGHSKAAGGDIDVVISLITQLLAPIGTASLCGKE